MFAFRLAFPCWILSMVFFHSVLIYAVAFSCLTGACHLAACCLFASIRNPTKLKIPFEDGALEFTWGWTFYLCVINGLWTSLLRTQKIVRHKFQILKIQLKLFVFCRTDLCDTWSGGVSCSPQISWSDWGHPWLWWTQRTWGILRQ